MNVYIYIFTYYATLYFCISKSASAPSFTSTDSEWLPSGSVVVAPSRLLSQSPGIANGHHLHPCSNVQAASRWRGGQLLTSLSDTKSNSQPLRVQQPTSERFISNFRE